MDDTPQRPLVSVVTPVFNGKDVISRAIHSVRDQSISDWEHIVIDDGSTDGTANILKDLARGHDKLIVLTLEQNAGVSAARNCGTNAARGRYIAFLDADDEWLKEKLELQLQLAETHPGRLYFSGFFRQKPNLRREVRVPKQIDRATLLRGNAIGCLTAMYDTQSMGKRYFPELEQREDWALWLDILADHGPAYAVDRPLAIYHEQKNSLSSNKLKALKANYRLYHQREELSAVRSAFLVIGSTVRRLVRG